MTDELLAVWGCRRDDDISAMARAALDMERVPDLHVRLLSSTGDTITVQVTGGIVPVEPAALVYVQRRGMYALSHRESWSNGRVLLKLAAWPSR